LPTSQDELPPRSMRDSYDECIIPLATSLQVQKSHISASGIVRFGRILEDMDVFAVWLCYRHLQYPGMSFGVPMPVNVVTALVDNIHSESIEFPTHFDIKLRGHISWVGRTSLESTMEVLLYIFFCTTCLAEFCHSSNGDATLRPFNDQVARYSQFLFCDPRFSSLMPGGREVVESRRKAFQEQSILKVPPNREERMLLHKLFQENFDPETYILKSDECPHGAIWMHDAKLTNVIICQPEFENLYNKVFGGFLMRSAYELAWSTAYLLSGRRPRPYHTDDIWFRKPVEVGSLLHYEAQVVYTRENFMQLNVNATVINPNTGSNIITNVFHFTFQLDGEGPAPRVTPKSYPESLLYIEGRRYLEMAMAIPEKIDPSTIPDSRPT
ncbi:acyl-CoA thioesterase, putative, partial [Ixodes scapularis]